MHTISVIMPVYNGESTLAETLKSLFAQSKKFDELIIINDASTDRSKEILEKHLRGKTKYQLVNHEKNLGLARSYNQGISLASGNLIVTLHQDIVLLPDALKELLLPFSDKDVVAAGHVSSFPCSMWKRYNFWQKCYFSRFMGKEIPGLNGQFDCFRKTALEKVGLFDEKRFRSAGEDGDIVYKLSKLGKIAQTKAKLLHLQSANPDFGPRDIIFKQKQHSEARGALLALGRIGKFSSAAKIFFREIMVLTLFIPYVKVVSLIMIICYSFLYTKCVFLKEYRNKRIFILPFFNIFLLFVGFLYSIKGFVYGRQKI